MGKISSGVCRAGGTDAEEEEAKDEIERGGKRRTKRM
jgi:hypothetical protein